MLREAADQVAREFIARAYRNVREFDVTVARNTILDCLYSAKEDNFIAKAARDPLIGRDARRVIRKMRPHLVELAGRTVERARAV